LSITGATLSMNGYLYRCVETNSVGIATSSSALLKVTLPLRDSADFNGDGMTDILWQNTATGQRAIWLMNGIQNGFQPTAIVDLGWVDLNWSIAGTGDFNGDGMTDILWQNITTGQRALWLMNGIQNGFQPTAIVDLGWVDLNWLIVGAGDFNGDGMTDILWQKTTDGQRALWLMNGIQNGFHPAAIVNLGWVDINWSMKD
jgi:hypothetical protein